MSGKINKEIIINFFLIMFTLAIVFIANKIVSNTYRDNMNYNKSYFSFKQHSFLQFSNEKLQKDFYLINATLNKRKDALKYYLIDKKKPLKNISDNIIKDDKYNLVSQEIILDKYDDNFIDKSSRIYCISDKQSINEAFSNYVLNIGSK